MVHGAPRVLKRVEEEEVWSWAFGRGRLTHQQLAELATAKFGRKVPVAMIRRTLKRTSLRPPAPSKDCFLPFKDDGATLRRILGVINDTKRTLDVSIFVLAYPEVRSVLVLFILCQITEAIIAVRKRKVTVRVITDHYVSASELRIIAGSAFFLDLGDVYARRCRTDMCAGYRPMSGVSMDNGRATWEKVHPSLLLVARAPLSIRSNLHPFTRIGQPSLTTARARATESVHWHVNSFSSRFLDFPWQAVDARISRSDGHIS